MRKIILCGIVLFSGVITLLGVAQSDGPLVFVEPLAEIPTHISAQQSIVVQFTIKNDDSKLPLPIYPSILDEHGNPNNSIIKRIEIGINHDCGEPGARQLALNESCALTYEITTPAIVGQQVNQTLSIDYWGDAPLTTPITFTVGEFEPFAFVVDKNNIFSCNIDFSQGTLSQCDDSGAGSFSHEPTDIAFVNINGVNYAYIAHVGRAQITQCLQRHNLLQDCNSYDVNITSKNSSITFYKGDRLYAYVTPVAQGSSSSSVYKCAVAEDSGKIENCANLAIDGDIVTFQSFGPKTYAYIGNLNSMSLNKCTVQKDGSFTDCVDPMPPGYYVLNHPAEIGFAKVGANTYAYIAEYGTPPHNTPARRGAISRCTVDIKTGDFVQDSCAHTGQIEVSGIYSPIGIIVREINQTQYIYVADHGSDNQPSTIWKCAIHDAGDLDCKDSGVNHMFSMPLGLALY